MSNLTQAPAPIDQGALARLREKARLSAEIQVWKPDPGDVLEGAIVGSRKVDGPYGEQPQALVQTPDGQMMAVWLTPWLTRQFQAQNADLGDLLSLTYHGKQTGTRGQTFNRMTVTVLKIA